MRRWLACIVASILLAAGAAAEGPRGALRVDGYVTEGTYGDDLIWFALSWTDELFVAEPTNVPNPNAFWKAVYDASKDQRSLTVWFDPETAYIDRKNMVPVFVVRTVEYGGRTIAGDIQAEPRDPKSIKTPQDKAEYALAQGIGYYSAGQSAKALPLVNKGLAFELEKPLKSLGLKVRSSLLEEQTLSHQRPGEARDRGLFAALQDVRVWRQLEPGSVDPALSEAWFMVELGGYDEALAIYTEADKRWPKETWNTYRGISELNRLSGQYQLALDWLDKAAGEPLLKSSMPYRYHRGKILDDMGRFEDAVAEYSEGLKTQPDFEGAFRRRACDYAELGQLELALYDVRTARDLRDKLFAEFQPTPALVQDRTRYGEVEALLAAAVATDAHRKITGLCKGYWDWGDNRRSRSKLLPAAR